MSIDIDLIWYVSYGSNLLAERFAVYLEGGMVPGHSRVHTGARDSTSWRDSCSMTLPHELFFAGESVRWPSGGSAFVDPHSADAIALARGYLITAEQFQDVLAQECGRAVGTEVDFTPALVSGTAVLGTGRYDRVLCSGCREGYPMLTFTTPRPVDELKRNAPSSAYSQTIIEGLKESHGLTSTEAEAYIGKSTPYHYRDL